MCIYPHVHVLTAISSDISGSSSGTSTGVIAGAVCAVIVVLILGGIIVLLFIRCVTLCFC